MPDPFLLGVNLAGAEFGSNVPGTFGTDYTYPTHAEIDYYASKGMSVIRLPFLWERIQHTQNGSLDSVELGRLDDVVNYTTGKGLKIEIEPHNYGYGFGALIGSTQTPNSAFADVWGKLALHFKSNPDVIFGLMNEPHDQSASAWLGSANAAIAAIRNAGASQEILVPGSYWDGAWTWTSTDNAAVIGTGVQDAGHNFAFEVHQYLDADGSGTHSGVVSANHWRRTIDRHHAMGGSERTAFVPRRSRRHHGPDESDRARRHADLHAAAYRRLAGSDVLGGRPMVGELHVLDRAAKRHR
jgi:endoglucanase